MDTTVHVDGVGKKQDAYEGSFELTLCWKIIIIDSDDNIYQSLIDKLPVVVLVFVIDVKDTHYFFCFDCVWVFHTNPD